MLHDGGSTVLIKQQSTLVLNRGFAQFALKQQSWTVQGYDSEARLEAGLMKI